MTDMDNKVNVARNVEIVSGYKTTVAYNFSTSEIFEFDRSLGAFFLDILPAQFEEIVDKAVQHKLIKSYEAADLRALTWGLIERNIFCLTDDSSRANWTSVPRELTPRTLVLEIITRCNFNCRHCYLGNRLTHSALLSIAEIADIVADARDIGIERVQLTGGNPSLHPDIVRIVNLINDFSLEIIYFTNGSCLSQKILMALKEANASLHISVYGMSNDSGQWLTRRTDYFNRLLKAIARVKSSGVKIRSLDYMVVRENIHEIDSFVEFCQKENFFYRFDSPAPIGNAYTNKIQDQKDIVVELIPRLPDFASKQLFRFQSCEFDQPTILANGDVTFCILGNNHFHDHVLGNIYQNNLSHILSSKKALKIRRSLSVSTQPICRQCEYKYLCGGLCPFSKKFNQLTMLSNNEPDCLRYQNKRFRNWKVVH